MPDPTPDALAARYGDPVRLTNRIEVDAARFERAPGDVGEQSAHHGRSWGVGALVADDGRALFVREGDTWLLPGGRLEAGEVPADGAVREVAEETGIDVDVIGLGAIAEQTLVHRETGATREFAFATFLAEPRAESRPAPDTTDDRIDEVAWLAEVPSDTFDRELVVRLFDELF